MGNMSPDDGAKGGGAPHTISSLVGEANFSAHNKVVARARMDPMFTHPARAERLGLQRHREHPATASAAAIPTQEATNRLARRNKMANIVMHAVIALLAP